MKKPRERYTDEEIAFIRQNWQEMTDRELAEQIGRTWTSVKTKRRRLGLIYKDYWSDEEIEYLRENYADTNTKKLAHRLGRGLHAVYGKAKSLGLSKSGEFLQSEESGRILPGQSHPGSVRTQFKKGHTPHNKGEKGVCYPGSEKGWFKKGDKPPNTKHDGAITRRAEKNGAEHHWIRLSEGEWMPLQRYLWEMHNGPIPEGTVLRCKSSDTLNANPENWELITRAEHAVRNGDPEIARQAIIDYVAKHGHPAKDLHDGYVASLIADGDPDLKEYIIAERPDLIRAARANYQLKRKIKNHESTTQA